jgi:ribonuclease PH
MTVFKREDGRKPEELRPVSIERNYLKGAEGSALITCGDTKVICAATIEERVPPWLRNKGKGWITAEYGMLPRSSPERIMRESKSGKTGGRTHEIERLIGRSLRAVADLDALGERMIIVDCDVIQADGGTRTASITGGYLALSDALEALQKRLKVKYRLLHDQVAAVSVGIVSGKILLDLAYAEDSQAAVDMNVVMTGSGEFVEIQGTGEGRSFSLAEHEKMLNLAKAGIRDLFEIQKQALRASG